eukprot:jgi/Galph1/4789/GphlegSOOS_G3476.1
MFIHDAFKTKKPRDSVQLEKKSINLDTLSGSIKKNDTKRKKKTSLERSSGDIPSSFLKVLLNTTNNSQHDGECLQSQQETGLLQRQQEVNQKSHLEEDNSNLPENSTSISDHSTRQTQDKLLKFDKTFLPENFVCLLDLIQALENARILLSSRNQLALLSRVQPIVERYLRRNLKYQQLCQISNLCPEALELRRWKHSTKEVELIFHDASNLILENMENNGLSSKSIISKEKTSRNDILSRRILLHRRLVEKAENGDYQLDSTDPLNSDEANQTSKKTVDANELSESSADLQKETGKGTESASVLVKEENNSTKLADSSNRANNGSCSNEMQALELRDKERNSIRESQKQQLLYSRLPKLADFIRTTFFTCKKTVLPMDLLLQKLKNQESLPFSFEELCEQLVEISRIVPEWLQIEDNNITKLVKLSSHLNYSNVRKKIVKLNENGKHALSAEFLEIFCGGVDLKRTVLVERMMLCFLDSYYKLHSSSVLLHADGKDWKKIARYGHSSRFPKRFICLNCQTRKVSKQFSVSQCNRRHVLKLFAVASLLPLVVSSASAEASGFTVTGQYEQDVRNMVQSLRLACVLQRDSPDYDMTVKRIRKQMNDFVSFYRRKPNISGSPSFSTLYTAINTVAGHYTTFGPEFPIPEKRKKRLEQQFQDVERAVSRGR